MGRTVSRQRLAEQTQRMHYHFRTILSPNISCQTFYFQYLSSIPVKQEPTKVIRIRTGHRNRIYYLDSLPPNHLSLLKCSKNHATTSDTLIGVINLLKKKKGQKTDVALVLL